MSQPYHPGNAPRARSHLNDAEERLERKGRQLKRGASDGIANGLVQILATLEPDHEVEIRNIVKNVTERERDEHSRVLDMGSDEDGLWVETETEKHAQHIADAISRARNMELESYYDDSGKQRVLTLRFKAS
jgi:hypothetical protein